MKQKHLTSFLRSARSSSGSNPLKPYSTNDKSLLKFDAIPEGFVGIGKRWFNSIIRLQASSLINSRGGSFFIALLWLLAQPFLMAAVVAYSLFEINQKGKL